MDIFYKFLKWAEERDWIIQERHEELPNTFADFDGKLGVYESIIKKYGKIMNSKKNTWFVLNQSEIVEYDLNYEWDYCRNICVSAYDEEKEDEKEQIIHWWSEDFPFMMSTGRDFEVYFINTVDGSIEYGFEPSFEETIKIADSIDDFFLKILNNEIAYYNDCFYDCSLDDLLE